MPSHGRQPTQLGEEPSAPQPDLGFSGFGLRCLQLNTPNNYSVAADRVALAAELDKFSRNMNNPAECLGNRRNSMNSRERMPTRVNRRPEPRSQTRFSDGPITTRGVGRAGRAVTARAARPPRTARSASQHLLSSQPELLRLQRGSDCVVDRLKLTTPPASARSNRLVRFPSREFRTVTPCRSSTYTPSP
jgi:hypothetical protein